MVDERNRDTILTVDHTQLTPLRSLNGKVEVDVALMNLGNGPGLRKQVKLFAKREMFEDCIEFDDVMLLVGQRDPIKIGKVMIKPDHTTAMKKDEGSSLRYVHSGVLLYKNTGLDMTGYCGCVYVAKRQGNWWIIGVHVGLQTDLRRFGLEKGDWQCGVLLCQDMLESAFPVETPKVAKEAQIPIYPEHDDDGKPWYPDSAIVNDRAFCSNVSMTKSFKEAYEGKQPVSQYAGQYGKPRVVNQKSGIVDSPVAHLTGTRHLYGVAYQGEKVKQGFPSTLEMLHAGLDRSTYDGPNMSGAAYKFVNNKLRSVILENPPSGPIKSFVTLSEVINGGWAVGQTVDPAAVLTSVTERRSGSLRFNGIDASASAGIPGRGLRQVDFLYEVEDDDGETLRMLDPTTSNGRMAIKLLKRILQMFRERKSTWMVFNVVLKDEALPMSKIKPWLKEIFPEEYAAKGGKTRVIMCMVFCFNLALKIHLLPVVTYLKALSLKIHLVTGRDPYSPDYQTVINRLYSGIQGGDETFFAADVSDQEKRIDPSTYGGFTDLVEMVYDIQSKIWCHKRGEQWENFRNQQRKHPDWFSDDSRVAAISSCLPSGNLIGSSVYYMCLRNQSGCYLTSMISTYYTLVSEIYTLQKAYGLARSLVSMSRFADNHNLTLYDPCEKRNFLACGDDQIARYSDELLDLFADANRLLVELPGNVRSQFPVPVELDREASNQRQAGSYVQACTLFFCGLPLVDPDTGGNCTFTSRAKATFLGNHITVNPELTALVAARGLRVSSFAVLRDVSRQKCLNFLRVSADDDPIAPLCQNFNTVLELTFTSGREAFDLCRNDLIDMMQHIDVEFPLVTFEQCLERFVSKDYVLGDENNVFDLH